MPPTLTGSGIDSSTGGRPSSLLAALLILMLASSGWMTPRRYARPAARPITARACLDLLHAALDGGPLHARVAGWPVWTSGALPFGALLTLTTSTRTDVRTSPKAIYAMVERGQLPGVIKIGRRVLVSRESLL